MSLGRPAWKEARETLQLILSADQVILSMSSRNVDYNIV